MEHFVDNYTAYGLWEARSHPEDHPTRAPELGEGAAGMVLSGATVNKFPAAPSPSSGARGGWSSGWDRASRSP